MCQIYRGIDMVCFLPYGLNMMPNAAHDKKKNGQTIMLYSSMPPARNAECIKHPTGLPNILLKLVI